MQSIRFPRSAALCLCIAGLSQLSGCAGPMPRMDHLFGQTVTQLTADQTLNPNAGLNRDPVKGMDGQAANAAYEQYQKSYTTPVPQNNTFTIGVAK